MMAGTLTQQYLPGPLTREALDWKLLTAVLILISFGVVMVASASIDFAASNYGDPWFFTKRHLIFLLLGTVGGLLVFSIPMNVWNRYSIVILFLGILLLSLVLVPGLGKVVNGSRRWFSIGPITIQASEVAKFCFVIFFSSFLARRNESFTNGWVEFFKLVCVLGTFSLLLLLEPDFGTTVVLCISAAAMMFVAGVPIIRFILLALTGVAGLAAMAVLSPYRWQRLVTFLDPWAEQFSSGYQLVQSLIAFGRGEWVGLGLGNSLQKLFFLPEAHTDFVFAIVAEEFGLVGALLVIATFVVLIWRIVIVASTAQKQGHLFMSFAAFGVAVLFGAQAFINMGVASGLLPTKGLTLPFISAGGSSLIVCCAFIAFVLRIDWELRRESNGE